MAKVASALTGQQAGPSSGAAVPPIGITVEDALQLPCLERARLVAGAAGSARRIQVVNIMEVPDIVRWMRGGELLLTTAYPVKDDASALLRLVSALDNRGVSALAVKFGPYLEAPPDGMLELADLRQFPLIEIPADVIFNDVLSQVLGTILNRQALELERLVTIHEQLTRVMLQGGSIAELAQALCRIISLPVAIVDTQSRVVASAGNSPVAELQAAHHPTVAEGSGQASAAFRRPIMVGSQPGGEVIVWPSGKSLQAWDVMTIERTATMAAVALAQEKALLSREQRHRALFLMELVSGRPVNPAEATRRATAMGWDLELPRAAVLVDLDKQGTPFRVAGQPVEERLSRIIANAAGRRSVVWALQSGVALLAEPKPSLEAVCSAVQRALATELPGLQVMIGAGSVYEDLEGLRRSYREAVDAVTLGRQLYDDDFVIQNSELGAYCLLGEVPDGKLRKHVKEALGPLLAYDERNHGDLVHTLEVFLGCHGNRADAARVLCVHYNTLRYRLDLIEKLTGGLDRNATSRFGLEMALYAQRLLLSRGWSQRGSAADAKRRR